MNPDLILRLVDLAISLAQSQMDSGDVKQALLGIVQKSVRAYTDHTGEPLDPSLIKAEEPV
jgi:hypothetical protein